MEVCVMRWFKKRDETVMERDERQTRWLFYTVLFLTGMCLGEVIPRAWGY
jgi:hypothetical protein